MAYTFAYLSCNGVSVTAGDYNLVVNVYKMNDNYTYDQIITNQAVLADGTYNISYASDGVYKITVSENGADPPDYYADINYCSWLGDDSNLIKSILCQPCSCNSDNIHNAIIMGILSFRFLAQNTYTPANECDFTDATTISELQKIHDAIKRLSKYQLILDNEGSCCTN